MGICSAPLPGLFAFPYYLLGNQPRHEYYMLQNTVNLVGVQVHFWMLHSSQ